MSATRESRVLVGLLFGLASAGAGCAAGGGDGGVQCAGKCDGLGEDFLGELEGRQDPVAQYLKQNADEEGFLSGDYGDMLFGIASVQGCSQDTIKTFSVSDDLVTGSEPFPRMISVACSDDVEKAAEFFIAASFESVEEPGEMDLRSVETFAWDASERRYRFYETFPADGGGVVVDPSPTRCQQCHLTSADMQPTAMRMTPIMNELTRPWTHWNARPGFPSHQFDVPERARSSQSFADLFEPFKGPAAEFEQIIRAGHAKVANARVRERRERPPDPEIAMGLLRPVFCNEQLNYASEDHESGILFNSVAVDPGLRNAFRKVRPDNWPWSWLNDEVMRVPSAAGETINQIPVRGNSDVTVENLLMSGIEATRALSPMQVLQVRALDWKHPVFSDFRCDLWKQAKVKFETEGYPDFGDASRTLQLFPILYGEIMQIGGRALSTGSEDTVISIGEADPETVGALFTALGEGSLSEAECGADGAGFCEADLDALGNMIEVHLSSIENDPDGRQYLLEERDRRICEAMEQVKVVDPRFDDERVQRSCAEDCCADHGMEGEEQCIGQAAEAARVFDTSRPVFECATECATPVRFVARPSLPDSSECDAPSRFLP